jgi:hypothetical protein
LDHASVTLVSKLSGRAGPRLLMAALTSWFLAQNRKPSFFECGRAGELINTLQSGDAPICQCAELGRSMELHTILCGGLPGAVSKGNNPRLYSAAAMRLKKSQCHRTEFVPSGSLPIRWYHRTNVE